MKLIKNASTLLLIVIFCLSLVACGSKTPITADEFKQTMEDKGFTVVDSTLFAQELVTAKSVTTAMCENYSIDFYVLNSAHVANELFSLNVDAFEKDSSSTTHSTIINGSNYDYYDSYTDSDFCVTSRIDDTLIYCYTDQEYKDEILDIIKTLEYN